MILILGLLYSQSAEAYLDSGAGSFILQMLIAGIMGAIFTIKLYWYRLKVFIKSLFGKILKHLMINIMRRRQKKTNLSLPG